MNKTYLIVGGASLASLAAGAAGGYVVAKRKFDATVDGLIAAEVEKTKKFYSIRMMELEAKNAKPASPADISPTEDDEELPLEGEEELTEADQAVIEKGRRTLAEAGRALVDYQGFADKKPPLEEIVTSNIFKNGSSPKKQMPPRGPGGKFVKKTDAEKIAAGSSAEQTPQLITQEIFLLNEEEYEQRNLLYFRQDDTMVDAENNNEVVDNGVVGEVNLTLFPEPDEHGYSAIYVRNEWLETDYEIRLRTESLTEFIGLGENEGADEDEYANLD